LQGFHKSCDTSLTLLIICGHVHEHANAPRPRFLLRMRYERPRDCRTSNTLDEVTPAHCLPPTLEKASYQPATAFWKGLARCQPMSALGQKQTFALQKVMSALAPKADMCGASDLSKPHHYSIIDGGGRSLRCSPFLIFIPSDEDCDDRRAD
jgi:hypothetical protein